MIYSLTFYAYYNLDADCACNKKKEIVWKELLKQEKVGVLLGKFLPTLLALSSYIYWNFIVFLGYVIKQMLYFFLVVICLLWDQSKY